LPSGEHCPECGIGVLRPTGDTWFRQTDEYVKWYRETTGEHEKQERVLECDNCGYTVIEINQVRVLGLRGKRTSLSKARDKS
jgi:ssDNA-binding Zn-finger/Zn-ribbon topoisomerase 1